MNTKYNNIPAELRGIDKWICWRAAPDPKPNNPQHIKKIPIDPNTGRAGSSTDLNTWADFQTALAACSKYACSGIGFVFTADSPYFGIDIDGVGSDIENLKNGELTGVLGDFVENIPSYTELSQSGKGLHIICRGSLPGERRRGGNVEMYETGRYFIMTGDSIGSYSEITDCTEAIKPLYHKYIEPAPTVPANELLTQSTGNALSIDEIISRAAAAENGALFSDLMGGNWQDHYKSQSEADMALCALLAFWTGKDREKMDEIFRTSGLMRGKWDEQHGADTYGDSTIAKAIKECKAVYDPNYSSGPAAADVFGKSKRTPITINDTYNFLAARDWLPHYNAITKCFEVSDKCKRDLKLDIVSNAARNGIIIYLTDELKRRYTGVTKDTVQDHISYIAATYTDSSGKRLAYNPVLSGIAQIKANHAHAPNGGELQALFDIMKIPADDTLSRTLIHKWLLQALAMLQNGKAAKYGLDGILVLNGAQGTGKSWFAARLGGAFDEFSGDGLFGSGSLKLETKDSIMQATRKWVFEVGEIEYSFRKSDLADFKQFITANDDEYRAPYARDQERHPRFTSFIASCNTPDYLSDTTGNRRFWTVPLQERFDFERLDSFDFAALWLLIAAELEQSNNLQCFRLTEQEQNELAERNGGFIAKAPAQQEIEDIFAKCSARPDLYVWKQITVTEFAAQHSELARYNSRVIGKAIEIVLNRYGQTKERKSIRINGAPVWTVKLPILKVFESETNKTFSQ